MEKSLLMIGDRAELYQRIQDQEQHQSYSLGLFKKKLARENGWSLNYTQRVIEEYKKFVFLAVVAGHTVVPPDAVDQVWHAHLGYTRSYWHDFCPQVLGMPLHHDPSGGDPQEPSRLWSLYCETLASYQRYFGDPPPQDIWPQPSDYWRSQRFFTRINRQQHWIFPKPNWSTFFLLHPLHNLSILLGIMAMLMVISGPAIAQIANPFNMAGPDFLAFYIPLSCFGIQIAYSLHTYIKIKQNPSDNDDFLYAEFDPYEIAFLAGGHKQVMIAAIANLCRQGLLSVEHESSALLPLPSGSQKLIMSGKIDQNIHFVEKELIKLIVTHHGKINPIRNSKSTTVENFRGHLQDRGLILKKNQAFTVQFYPCLIVVILLSLGLIKMVIGILREKPVFFLILCLIAIVVSSYSLFLPPHRSYNGDRLLKHLREQSQSLSLCGVGDQVVLAVALFGASVLNVEPTLANLHSILENTNGPRKGGWHSNSDDSPWLHAWHSNSDNSSGLHGGDGGGGTGGGCGGGGGGGGCGGCGGP